MPVGLLGRIAIPWMGNSPISNTKPGAPAATPDLLTEAHQRFNVPIAAIGGVTLDNAPGLIAQGASLIAVIHALFAAPFARFLPLRLDSSTGRLIKNYALPPPHKSDIFAREMQEAGRSSRSFRRRPRKILF